MTTPPLQLPFPLESGWDYIVTAEERNAADLMRSDDQWFDCDARTWRKAHAIGQPFADFNFYRRRKPASGWVRVADGSPEASRPVWVLSLDSQFSEVLPRGAADFRWFASHHHITHWRYCEGSYQIPPPPEPEREAWEVAMDDFVKSKELAIEPGQEMLAREFFKVGWAKAKEGK